MILENTKKADFIPSVFGSEFYELQMRLRYLKKI